MEIIIKILAGIVVSYLGIMSYAYYKQEALLFFPDNTDFENNQQVKAYGFKPHVVESNNLKLRYYEKSASQAKAILIHFHGNGGAAAHRLILLNELSGLPLVLMSMEYPGYSNDKGELSEGSFHAHARELFNLLKQQYPDKSIFLFGESLGTGIATKLAAEENINGLILQHPYTAIVDLAKHHYPFLPAESIVKHKFLSRKWAPKVTAPTLILQGDSDRVIPVENVKAQIKNFKNNPEFHIFQGRGHNDLSYPNAEFWQIIRSFIIANY